MVFPGCPVLTAKELRVVSELEVIDHGYNRDIGIVKEGHGERAKEQIGPQLAQKAGGNGPSLGQE